MKTLSIIIFSVFIFLILSFILLLSFPWIFASQHQSITFLGFFLVLFTIPIMLFILLRKTIKTIHILLYLIYFLLTSTINILSCIFIQEYFFYKFPLEFPFSQFFSISNIFFFYIFFSLQFPIIILCLIINEIKYYDKTINLKYFVKNPLIYIFMSSLILLPLIFINI
jgi:hypothetical protein